MGEREREKRNSSFREYIDDANDVLLKPFAGIVSETSGRWTQRGVPTLLGLLLYGFVIAYLARYAQGARLSRRATSASGCSRRRPASRS